VYGHVVVPVAASTVTCVCSASKTYDRVDEMTSTNQFSTKVTTAGGCVSTAATTCCTSLASVVVYTVSAYGGTSARVRRHNSGYGCMVPHGSRRVNGGLNDVAATSQGSRSLYSNTAFRSIAYRLQTTIATNNADYSTITGCTQL